MQKSNNKVNIPNSMTFALAYTLALLVATEKRGLIAKALESPAKPEVDLKIQ